MASRASEMAWATHCHGVEGKIHADRRTVEYYGRGNHRADALCVRGSLSVGHWHVQRLARDLQDAVQRSSPAPDPDPEERRDTEPESEEEKHDSQRQRRCRSSAAAGKRREEAADGDEDEHEARDCERECARERKPKSQNKSKNKNGRTKSRLTVGTKRKRRPPARSAAGVSAGASLQEELWATHVPKVFYFEIQVVATQAFQEDARSSVQRENHMREDRDDDEEEDGDEDGDSDDDMEGDEEEEEEGEDDEEDDTLLVRRVADDWRQRDAEAPWRRHARALVRSHLVDSSGPWVATGEGRRDGELLNGNGDEEQRQQQDEQEEEDEEDEEEERVREEDNVGSPVDVDMDGMGRRELHQDDGDGDIQAAHPLLMPFPLSSGSIHHIRRRLERSSSLRRGLTSGASSLSSNSSSSSSSSTSAMATSLRLEGV
ncbi:hypothetical protein P43SY_004546 [Pythium insidiosum]|uniref:Uncharacterized protein n=1 Tax=Pythium insidiosum TaxID=114742 RepID=A0AAD5M8M7_PYTIN|nr:hypothetical protein P43SY_004546 [Pythium insidiosum]